MMSKGSCLAIGCVSIKFNAYHSFGQFINAHFKRKTKKNDSKDIAYQKRGASEINK